MDDYCDFACAEIDADRKENRSFFTVAFSSTIFQPFQSHFVIGLRLVRFSKSVHNDSQRSQSSQFEEIELTLI
jgi:hypothetical protein